MNNAFLTARSRVVSFVRDYFDRAGFLEIHTPRLVGLPGQEPYLEPMWTHVTDHQNVARRAALITSPEYAMKRMLAHGFDKIYDLGPCFRNGEPWDGTHDPEFLMCEWYEKGIRLSELMDRTEAMITSVIASFKALPEFAAFKPSLIHTDGENNLHDQLEFSSFRRMTVTEAMQRYAHVDLDALLKNREAMAAACLERGQTVLDSDTWEDLFFKIFLSLVEPKLGWNDDMTRFQPTFLHAYPASMAALAQKDPQDPRYALRVELYIGSLELANGFVELSDVQEQRQRFEEEQALRRSLGKDTWSIDERFMEALPRMGQAAGIAFGVDRLAMLLTGATSISDLMPIPTRERF